MRCYAELEWERIPGGMDIVAYDGPLIDRFGGWAPAEAGARFLTPRCPGNAPVPYVLKEADMFARFAAVSGDHQAIRDFAAHYGFLRSPWWGIGPDKEHIILEELSLWEAESAAMIAALRSIARGDCPDEPGTHVDEREVLRAHAYGRQPEVTVHVPRSLLSAIWYQVWVVVEHDLHIKQCRLLGCKGWIVEGAAKGARRRSASFCSDSCRFKFYWRKRTEAKELHAAGHSVQDIATRLETSVDHVVKWVSEGHK